MRYVTYTKAEYMNNMSEKKYYMRKVCFNSD